jgi:hypothetical protein
MMYLICEYGRCGFCCVCSKSNVTKRPQLTHTMHTLKHAHIPTREMQTIFVITNLTFLSFHLKIAFKLWKLQTLCYEVLCAVVLFWALTVL